MDQGHFVHATVDIYKLIEPTVLHAKTILMVVILALIEQFVLYVKQD